MVGIDAGQAKYDSVEETGGAETVASSAQGFGGTVSSVIVNHTHTIASLANVEQAQGGTTASTTGTHLMTSTATGGNLRDSGESTHAANKTTGNPDSGGSASYTPAGTNTPGAATSVVQPYLVVYMWKRTA